MEIFKNLIKALYEVVKPYGFVKKGNTFYLNEDLNWGLIDFQKSRDSKSDNILFTINLGTCSNLLRVAAGDDINVRPQIEDCHWRLRVGFLLSEKKDYWWRIINETKEKELIEELGDMIKYKAIPEILNHITDDQLEAYWRSGESQGLTDFKRLVNLTLLLKNRRKEDLFVVVEELKKYSMGKPFENLFKQHIEELNF